MEPIRIAEDRSIAVQPHQTVEVGWVPLDACRFANRTPMSIESVIAKRHRLINLGDAAPWPPVVGHWDAANRFVVCDGRHDVAAALIAGRTEILACWVRDR